MKVFISHNKNDTDSARVLAVALVEQGFDVWFDEWSLRPGDSLTGGIGEGVGSCDVFVLMWSERAAGSNWVGTEVRAIVRRRVDDLELRIVPVMLDDTPLPPLVADYKGFALDSSADLNDIASEIAGRPTDLLIAQRLQSRLLELTDGVAHSGDPFPYLVCPKCASPRLKRGTHTDYERDRIYLVIWCEDCRWSDDVDA